MSRAGRLVSAGVLAIVVIVGACYATLSVAQDPNHQPSFAGTLEDDIWPGDDEVPR